MKPRPLLMPALAFALAAPAGAAVLTVGPDGDYADLDAALDVAAANGEDDNIRIQAGTLVIGQTASAVHAEDRFLEISGGWNASFDAGVTDPAATVLSGSGTGQVMALTVSAGEVIIRYLSLAEGSAPQGAGADLSVENSATLQFSDCIVRDNDVSGAAVSGGGGLRVNAFDSASVEVSRCRFERNTATATVLASGGGMLVVVNDGSFTSEGLVFEDNLVDSGASGSANGGGLAVDLGTSDGSATFRRLLVRGNLSSGALASGGAGMQVTSDGATQQLLVEGAQLVGNTDDSGLGQAAQLQVGAETGTLRLRSIAAVDGIGVAGVRIATNGEAQLIATNLTVAGNALDGYRHEAASSATQVLENSLAFGNGGADLATSNSVGGFSTFLNQVSDPGVVDAAGGNYRLSAVATTAINQAWSAPVAGLGAIDADGRPRVVDVVPDLGAFEFLPVAIFGNGFEVD